MTINFRDTDMQSLTRLHTLGLIDDKAFIEAIKKLNVKAAPYENRPLSPTVDVPFTQRISTGTGTTGSIEKYVSTTPNPYTMTYITEQDKMNNKILSDSKRLDSARIIKGLHKADPYSGSMIAPKELMILKPEGTCVWCRAAIDNQHYHDCKFGEIKKTFTCGGCGKTFFAGSVHLCDKSKREVAPPLTDSDWEFAMKGVLDMLAQPAKKVEVIAYSENRTLVPEHAKQVLEWIDEAWTKKVDEYNRTKDQWVRVQYKDKDGKEIVEWVDKSNESNKEAEDYEKWLSEDVVVEGDSAELNGLQHIFNLSITGSEC